MAKRQLESVSEEKKKKGEVANKLTEKKLKSDASRKNSVIAASKDDRGSVGFEGDLKSSVYLGVPA